VQHTLLAPILLFVALSISSIGFAPAALAAKHKQPRPASAQSRPSTAPAADTPPADPAELERLRGRIETLRKDLAGAEESKAEAGDSLRE
jgi:hypothetical protein